eukprot:TRINITY_DN7626_c0_g1_i1.p1 TRINITY_DN7626_c0_g1~~TRINITY_DN7626_c0_g1_i1.p1  ORF type:complete len:458 (-),score=80.64 TRINITY_DN7626_c0_g1_i1:74-1351(-)
MLRSLVGSEMCIRDSINAEYGGTSIPAWHKGFPELHERRAASDSRRPRPPIRLGTPRPRRYPHDPTSGRRHLRGTRPHFHLLYLLRALPTLRVPQRHKHRPALEMMNPHPNPNHHPHPHPSPGAGCPLHRTGFCHLEEFCPFEQFHTNPTSQPTLQQQMLAELHPRVRDAWCNFLPVVWRHKLWALLILQRLPVEIVMAVAVGLETRLVEGMASPQGKIGVLGPVELCQWRSTHRIPKPRRWLAHRTSRCAVCLRAAVSANRAGLAFKQHNVGDGWSWCGAAMCSQLIRQWSIHLHETSLTSKVRMTGIGMVHLPIGFLRPKLGVIQEAFLSRPQMKFDPLVQRMMVPVEWVMPEGCEQTKWVPLMNVVQHSSPEAAEPLGRCATECVVFPRGWSAVARSAFRRRVHAELELARVVWLVPEEEED